MCHRECFCVREDRQHFCGGQSFSRGAESDDARFDIGGRTGESSDSRSTGSCESDLRAVFAEPFDKLDFAAVGKLRRHLERDL